MEDKILIGDCATSLKQVQDESIDCIVTDPPYGIEFLKRDWDKALPSRESLKECFRVLKHGSFGFFMCTPKQSLLSRMIIKLEDVGFNTDFTSLYWVYATGYPKLGDISKMVDKRLGAEREVVGHKSQSNSLRSHTDGGVFRSEFDITAPATDEAKALEGSYTPKSIKPAVEIIITVQKPLSEKTYIDQALKNGKGVLWLDDCKIPYISLDECETNIDRFSANIVCCDSILNDSSRYFDLDEWFKSKLPEQIKETYPTFVVPKPPNAEKNKYMENMHDTIKPIKLMSYLITMGSRVSDTILDPFCGSGTTLEAARLLGRHFIGCEIDPKWKPIIESRAYGRCYIKNNKKIETADLDDWL